MTFEKFQQIFKTKYPEGEVFAHGTFGGTQRSGQVEVIFNRSRKCYTYNGTYAQILNRIGIKVVTGVDVATIKSALERCKRTHGTINPFCLRGNNIIDNSAKIREYEDFLEAIKRGDLIVVD